MSSNVLKLICLLLLSLILVSCGEAESEVKTPDVTLDTAPATSSNETAKTPETDEADLRETVYVWPADVPDNSVIITVFTDEGRKFKVVDDPDEIEYIVNFFEDLDKKELLNDNKGRQTVSVVINTEDIGMRLSFIGKSKLEFMGRHAVAESAYEDFLEYYESLDIPEQTEE